MALIHSSSKDSLCGLKSCDLFELQLSEKHGIFYCYPLPVLSAWGVIALWLRPSSKHTVTCRHLLPEIPSSADAG